jgi:hypothetical protein
VNEEKVDPTDVPTRKEYNKLLERYDRVPVPTLSYYTCPACGSTSGTVQGKRFWCNTPGCKSNRYGGTDVNKA